MSQAEFDMVSLKNRVEAHLTDLEEQKVDLVDQLNLEFAQRKIVMNEIVEGAKG